MLMKQNAPAQDKPQAAQADTTTESVTVQKAVDAIAAEGWMQVNAAAKVEPVISANELTSLSALIACVAHNSGENEFSVERRVSDRFNIPNVSCLPATNYDSAICYLVDGQ